MGELHKDACDGKAASPQGQQPDKRVRASVNYLLSTGTFSSGGVPGTAKWEETPGQASEPLEGSCLPPGQRTHPDLPGGAGGS